MISIADREAFIRLTLMEARRCTGLHAWAGHGRITPLARRADGLAAGICAGVTQLAECLLPKQNVVGSSPITRSLESGADEAPDSLFQRQISACSGYKCIRALRGSLIIMMEATED